MALDTDRIWQSLGSFFNLFEQEDRVYLSTFWESWAGLTADLWGFAFQVDRSKSLFSTTATFERRNVLVQLSKGTKQPSFSFALSSVQTQSSGAVVVRGFVPRASRTFKANEIPSAGWIRIGNDTVEYIAVNTVAIVGGVFDGYVREASFTLRDATLPHDYADTIDMNDSFFMEELEVAVRVDQNPGQNYLDTALDGQQLSINPTGKIRFGEPGINRELIEFQSITTVGDQVVFNFPATYSPGQSTPPATQFGHLAGEPVFITHLSPTRWSITRTNQARVYNDGAAVMVIDNSPGVQPAANVTMQSQFELQENVDFDIAVTLFPEVWGTVATSSRRSGIRLDLGGQSYVCALRATSSGFSFQGGIEGSPSTEVLTEVPSQVELRFARTGATLEVTVRDTDDGDARAISILTVTGQRARLSLFLDDAGTDTPSRVRFDEVVRRLGQVAGSTRLVDSFVVDDLFPYRYTTDVQLTDANALADDPRTRTEELITVGDVIDTAATEIFAMGDGDSFKFAGIPAAGELVIGGFVVVYDSFTRDGALVTFKVRGPLDPDMMPLPSGSSMTARTRAFASKRLFSFPTPGELWFRDAPTRLKMWAPVAQEDQRHVQRLYGPLIDLVEPEVSSAAYLGRVQGAWYALMSGPSIENAHIGIHLAMGLPVAPIAGIVLRTYVKQNELGDVTERGMVIVSDKGTVTQRINPKIEGIDWAYKPGEFVEKFAPLTNGVDVYDFDKDPNWPSLFSMDPTSPERFNAFGVLVDTNVLNEDTSLEDAVRFALRLKPTWAKMFFSFLLTAGNEEIAVNDDGFFAGVSTVIEDISFSEGTPPSPQPALRMGDGHKMGQGFVMGSIGVFKPFPIFGIGLHMGTNLTMGMPQQAYIFRPTTDNIATEVLVTQQVIEIEGGA